MHACVVDQGKARCTGSYNRIGKSTSYFDTNVLTDVDGVDMETVVEIDINTAHSCLRTSTGGAKCWGPNDYGELGNPAAIAEDKAFPVIGFETSGVFKIAVAASHTCLINTAGKVYCAGWNAHSQLGRGTSDSDVNSLMQPVVGDIENHRMVSISCGQWHCCTISDDETLYCWGSANYGQLGLRGLPGLVPTLVPGLNDVAMVFCGSLNTFVVLNNQGVKAFGFNMYGDLGLRLDGDNKYVPVTVFADQTNVVGVAGGQRGACVRLESGAIRCYGWNTYGKLGNNSPDVDSNTFVDVLYFPLTDGPTILPTISPTLAPSALPTRSPTFAPTHLPSEAPSSLPTRSPTSAPTHLPTNVPSTAPTLSPTRRPTKPTKRPTAAPTRKPSKSPTPAPTAKPTKPTTFKPSKSPSPAPTKKPSKEPTVKPTKRPTSEPTFKPSKSPSPAPTKKPSKPTTFKPSKSPSPAPTKKPTKEPIAKPTKKA